MRQPTPVASIRFWRMMIAASEMGRGRHLYPWDGWMGKRASGAGSRLVMTEDVHSVLYSGS